MSTITEVDIENFIKQHKRRKVKNQTIWHYVKDIRALFYWAMEKRHKFVRINPVVDADLDLIQKRKAVKPPLNLKSFERAFSVLDQYERAWWRTHECLGLRMDEGNPLENRSGFRNRHDPHPGDQDRRGRMLHANVASASR